MLGAKYGLHCTNRGSVLHATIHGSCVSKGAKYKFVDNPWIVLHKQLIVYTCILVVRSGPGGPP